MALKKYVIFIDGKKVYTKKLKEKDSGSTFHHDLGLDFAPDGLPATSIYKFDVKVPGGTTPPPVVTPPEPPHPTPPEPPVPTPPEPPVPTPPEPTGDLIKIGHCGDTHGNHKAVEMMVTRDKVNFVLHSGDATDDEQTDDGYVDTVQKLGLVYGQSVANSQGNHESAEEGGEEAQADFETAFPVLKDTKWLQFYQIKNVAIIINNTQLTGYSQLDSIASKHVFASLEKVKQLRAQGKIDWVIFMQHKPMYVLQGGHDPEYNFRYNHHAAMDAAGVDIWVSGHVHNEQRTKPLLFGGPGTNVAPIVNDKMIGDAHNFSMTPHGLICCQNGSSTKSHKLEEQSNAWTVWAADDGDSYTVFEIQGKNLTGKFVDIDTGAVRHQFRVTKGETVPPVVTPPEPPAGQPIVNVQAPLAVEPLAAGTIDASRSVADNVVIYSTDGIPLLATNHIWKKNFIAPSAETTLRFTATATKGTFTAEKQVSVQVKAAAPPVEGEYDAFGMKMLFKPTGKKVAMEKGSDHRNGQRFSVNHRFTNYIHQGYYKIGQGQDKINIKGDGLNHGNCDFIDSKQECLWYEMDINLSNGKFELQYEFPHADNYNVPDNLCEFVKTVGGIKAGQWIGWANAYWWGSDGLRHMKGFVDLNPFDANGKPLNNWQEGLYAIEKGQLVTQPQKIVTPRTVPVNSQDGLEAEIRMNNGTNHDTDFKNAWVVEIIPPN